MTIQWEATVGFLYAEAIIVLLFLLPCFSATWWSRIFKSNFCRLLSQYFNVFFKVIILILTILLLDAIRELYKYASAEKAGADGLRPDTETLLHMKMFRAQRNLYITGFSLFLWFVLNRLVSLITTQAQLLASQEAAMKQAQSASQAAQRLIDEADNKKTHPEADASEEIAAERDQLQKRLFETRKELDVCNDELKRTKLDLETLQKQATQNNRQYDEMLAEHEKVQKQLAEIENIGGSKKGD